VRYLREYQALGTAGGLYLFRDAILKGDPKTIIVMHADVCCSFPLEDMLAMHIEKEAIGTMLGTKVPPQHKLTRSPPKQHATTAVLYPIHRPMKSCITSRNHPRISPPQSIVAYTFSTPLFSRLSAKS
jgi:Nucleotidyl transferase